VLNLIGTRVNTKHWDMYNVHVTGCQRIARIAREQGVERLVHLSAMNADPNYQPVIYKKAKFLKSKGLGEQAVRDEFPNATIIRPSNIYGVFDKYIFEYMSWWRVSPDPITSFWVYKNGQQTFKMPIYNLDASLGIANAVMDPTAAGKTYEFVGPHCYKLAELIDFMFAKGNCIPMLNYKFRRHGFYDPYMYLVAFADKIWTTMFPQRSTGANMEWIEFSDGASDILTGAPLISELGVKRLAEFENAGGYYAHWNAYAKDLLEKLGDYPQPRLPLRSPPLYKHAPPDPRNEEIKTVKKPFGLSVLQSVKS